MTNKQHLDIIKQGVNIWYLWRKNNPEIQPDLSEANLVEENLVYVNFCKTNLGRANLKRANLKGANLIGAKLIGADLAGADLYKANLMGADLSKTNLSGANLAKANLGEANVCNANLVRANLVEANLVGANFTGVKLYKANIVRANCTKASFFESDLYNANLFGVDLTEADLSRADLTRVNFTEANLTNANLTNASLVETNFGKANLTGCHIYGISAWRLNLKDANQLNLIITPLEESVITVDNIEVAQFIYLLLHNEKIRYIIDTITSKVVLILGRFTSERKAVLDTIREEVRRFNYLPVMFDFNKPASRDITETVSTLAHMARFIIADITNAKSLPQELERIVPNLPSVPVLPLLQGSFDEYGMFEHFKRYPWVLKIHQYKDTEDLIKSIEEKVISPLEAKVKELRGIVETSG